MMDPEQKSDYIRAHFWDKFDFSENGYLATADSTEVLSIFQQYAALLAGNPLDTVSTAAMMQKASANRPALEYFSKMAQKFLHDPNSPLRNDEAYIPVLRARLGSSLLSDEEKMKDDYTLKLICLNRLGHKANDFLFVTERLDEAQLLKSMEETAESQNETILAAAGKSITPGISSQKKMSKIDTDFILIFFNNPGCPMCRTIKEDLMSSDLLSMMIADKTLTILALYPDENLDAWRAYHPYLPDSWINAYNPGKAIENQSLYNLSAIPSLYLLDRNKIVIAKDETDIRKVESVLANYPSLQ